MSESPRPALWVAAASAGLFAFALAFFRIEDLDWHWCIGVGRWILDHGTVPRAEPFSFTAGGNAYRAEHWLGEVVFALLWGVGGTKALVLFKALLFGGMAALLAAVGSRSIGPAPSALVSALVALSSIGQMYLRLYIFSPLFVLIEVLLLERWRRTGRGLWWTPLIGLLWMNLHGSGFLAVAIIAAYLMGELLARDWAHMRALALALVAIAAATCITPYGWGMWQEAWAHAVTERHHTVIQEFQPLWTTPLWRLVAIGSIAALALIALIRSRLRGISPGLVIVCLAFLALGLGAKRHIVLFVWPAGVLILQGLRADPPVVRSRGAWSVALLLAILSLLILTDRFHISLGSERRAGWGMKRGVVPEEALAAMRRLDLEGNLFNTYENGGLVIRDAPEWPVFIDNRYRPFEAILADYGAVAQAAPEWQQVLQRWDIGVCLLDPGRLELIQALWQSPLWSLAVVTGDGAVFVRRPSNAPEIDPEAAITHWLDTHPLPEVARWWQGAPPPREHLNIASLAYILERPALAHRIAEEVLARWPGDERAGRILSAVAGETGR